MSLRLQCNNLRLQLSKAAIRRLLLAAPGAPRQFPGLCARKRDYIS